MTITVSGACRLVFIRQKANMNYWILLYILHPMTTLGTFQSEQACLDVRTKIVAERIDLGNNIENRVDLQSEAKRYTSIIKCIKAAT